jgi:hypothetical protein
MPLTFFNAAASKEDAVTYNILNDIVIKEALQMKTIINILLFRIKKIRIIG